MSAQRIPTGVLIAVVTPLATAAVVAFAWYQLSTDCPGFDDEGIVRAPASWQGRVVCSDGGTGDPRVWTLLVLAVALGLVAEVVWLSARRLVWVVPVLVLVVASPLITAASFSLLPADCTSGQRQELGAAGCERDLELRLE